MSATLFKNESRGGENYDWLRTKYSYSFANYYDPERMNFGALRVVNDDWIAPSAGFPTHPHQNMEIITIPLSGALAHTDDAGGEGVVKAGMVQVMSAGTGVLHSEFNKSDTEPVELFQIWIEPSTYGETPRYQEAHYFLEPTRTTSALLVGPKEESEIWVRQEAYISRINILPGESFLYLPYQKKSGVYLMAIEGKGEAFMHTLQKRDALEVRDEQEVRITATERMDILCIEIPLK